MRIEQVVFGCGPVGSYAADGDGTCGRAALAAALHHGVGRFDAAPSYGEGRAEELLGDALHGHTGPLVVSTKVGRLAMANANPYARPHGVHAAGGGGRFDFTSSGVRKSLAASLRRLRRDFVDVVFLHDPECAPEQLAAQALPELRRQRDAGRVGALGVATTDPDTALRLVERGDVEHVMIAAAWTLTRRRARRLLDRCAERDVPVLAAGPFDSGLLATARPRPTAPWAYRQVPADVLQLAHRLADSCERHGVSLPQAALQFPLRHPAVTGVVVGMRSAAEVAADLDLLAPVPEAVWPDLDACLPPNAVQSGPSA